MGFNELIIEETKITNKKYKNIIVNKLFVFSRDVIECIEKDNPDDIHISFYITKKNVEIIINNVSFEVLAYIEKEEALFIKPADYVFLPNGIKDEVKKN